VKSFVIKAPNFSLRHTLECGQVFRWDKIGVNEYEGVAAGSIIRIIQKKDALFIRSSNSRLAPSFITSYFDLTLDLPYIYNTIGQDKHIRAAINRFRGLRIIRQPLWECTSSFIISAYNNIPRIKGIINNLCGCSGKQLFLGDRAGYSFPEPRFFAHSGSGRLRRCGTGFRASYLKSTARAFLEGKINLRLLKEKPYKEAKEILMRLDGVGPKVADCVLLYSVGKLEAFPVDVWIKRVMQTLYFNGRHVNENRIREFAGGYFGKYAGYAQQYLYHYARRGK